VSGSLAVEFIFVDRRLVTEALGVPARIIGECYARRRAFTAHRRAISQIHLGSHSTSTDRMVGG